MKEKTLKWIIAALAVLLLAGVTAYAATNYGSKDDPLITKSYLDEVVKPELESELQSKLDAAASNMLRSAPGEFAKVELQAGQTLRCAAGAFSDTTAGAALAAGAALPPNHLCLATEDGGVSAAAAATVLVSGTYRIE